MTAKRTAGIGGGLDTLIPDTTAEPACRGGPAAQGTRRSSDREIR